MDKEMTRLEKIKSELTDYYRPPMRYTVEECIKPEDVLWLIDQLEAAQKESAELKALTMNADIAACVRMKKLAEEALDMQREINKTLTAQRDELAELVKKALKGLPHYMWHDEARQALAKIETYCVSNTETAKPEGEK